jgi:hypothetical protein
MNFEKFELRPNGPEFRFNPAEPPAKDRVIDDAISFPSKWACTPDDADELHAQILPSLTKLAQRARSGDGKALWYFLKLANEMGEGLWGMMEVNRESMRPFARQCGRWPMMRSTNPRLCAPDEWLSDLQLGDEVPIQNDQHSKVKPDHAADVARQLFFFLEDQRQRGVMFILPDGKRRKAKDVLPPFTTSSAKIWWPFAEHTFSRSYPEPEKDEWLSHIASTPSRRRSPGRMREQILTKIRERFLHMAR